GCKDLSAAIDELLDVTRIEAGQLRLDFAPVDLNWVIAGALRDLQPRFEDTRIGCDLVREGESSIVWGDAARLRTVLTNLLTNALKYSPASGVVTVRIA